ncbi:glycosyltransferase 61 family protein [Celeribacter sp. ULVN23_4]
MFDPQTSLTGDIITLENALIVPWGEGRKRGISRPAGVYDANGVYQPISQCFRNTSAATTTEPKGPPPEAEEELKGSWLFGGLLYQHFGHALLESTSRLWARSVMPEVENVAFLMKKNPTWPNRFLRPMQPMIDMFSGGIGEMAGIKVPTRVERLVLAPQAFGTGDMITGSPEFRDHIHKVLADRAQPEGPEKIYISRTELYSKRGRYLAEDRIEALLKAEGYHIYHPQTHDLEAQAAQYAAAHTIISSDNSALHLAAFFARPQTRLAIIQRRPADVLDDYLSQYKWFAEVQVNVIDALNGRYYQVEGSKTQSSELYSELDFTKLGAALAEAGYIGTATDWTNPSTGDLAAERELLAEKLGANLQASDLSD